MSNGTNETAHGPMGFQLLKNTAIDFMAARPWTALLSSILVLLGIFASVQIFVSGNANLGIEFTGGTSVTIDFENPISIEAARTMLAQNGFPNAQLTTASGAGGSDELIVSVKQQAAPGQDVGAVSNSILNLFTKNFPDNSITDHSSTSIGPEIGSELRGKAVWAILYAIIGIIAYIALRFDFKFGVAATVAMFHDVLAIVGIMWLKNLVVPTEFTLLIMTAVLTLAGYSLTDTVVVFDRIRENLRKHRRAPLLGLINDSINQVLSRTIVTSLTTLLVVIAIFFFGGDVLHNFAFAMICGIIVGTYSSIYVASSIVSVWSGGRGKLIGSRADAASAKGKVKSSS